MLYLILLNLRNTLYLQIIKHMPTGGSKRKVWQRKSYLLEKNSWHWLSSDNNQESYQRFRWYPGELGPAITNKLENWSFFQVKSLTEVHPITLIFLRSVTTLTIITPVNNKHYQYLSSRSSGIKSGRDVGIVRDHPLNYYSRKQYINTCYDSHHGPPKSGRDSPGRPSQLLLQKTI